MFRCILVLLMLCGSLSLGADVSWTGKNGNWDDATNWSSDPLLPTPADNVSIIVPNAIQTITHTDGETIIDSLILEERLRVTAGSLTVENELELLPGSSVTSNGQFIAKGVTTADLSSLFAGTGIANPGTLALPMLTTYGKSDAVTFSATESGSLLDLSALQTLNGPNNSFRVFSISARRGGQIDLSALTNVNRQNDTAMVKISAEDVGTVVDLSGINDLVNTGITDIAAINGGEILWGDLRVANHVNFRLGGAFITSNLTAVTNGSISAENKDAAAPNLDSVTNVDSSSLAAGSGVAVAGQLALPMVTTYSTSTTTSWTASEPESRLDLSSLRVINGPDVGFRTFVITASTGSSIDLSQLETVNKRNDAALVKVIAQDEGSLIDLSGLNDLVDSGITDITVLENAEIKWGNLTAADKVNIRLGGTFDTSNLTSVTNGSLAAENGMSPAPNLDNVTNVDSSSLKAGLAVVGSGRLTLPKLKTYSTTTNTIWSASENDSLLDLSSLETINGPSDGFRTFAITASRAGKIDLSHVTSINQRNETSRISVTAMDGGSVIDLSRINDLTDSGITDITVLGGGEIKLGSLVTADQVDFRLGGVLDTASLTSVTNGSIRAENGDFPQTDLSKVTNVDGSSLAAGLAGTTVGVLTLPQLTTYSTDTTKSLTANGVGSLLDLSSLQTIQAPSDGFQTLSISAERSGRIDLSRLTGINRRNDNSNVNVVAREDAVINLTALPQTGGIALMQAVTSGQILLGNLEASDVEIVAKEGGQIVAERLTLSTNAVLFGEGIKGSVTNKAGLIDITEPSMRISGQYFHNGGQLTIPEDKSLEVGTDYDNSQFGVGNQFSHRAAIPGEGSIVATSAGQEITGSVTNGNSASPIVGLGNVHVGDTLTNNYGIKNTGNSTSLRGAMKTVFPDAPMSNDLLSGPGVSGNFGPIPAGETQEFSVSVTPLVAGPIPEQQAFIDNNFDNVDTQVITFTATAYRLAEATVTPSTIDFGIVHVGDVLSPRPIDVGNEVIADEYSEILNVTARTEGDAQTAGTVIRGLAPQARNNTDISALLDTATSGLKNGSIVLDFDSDGAGTSELGMTRLSTSGRVAVSGQVNAYAVPALVFENVASVIVDATGNYEVDFGTIFQGRGPSSIDVILLNDVATPADDLAGAWTTASADFVFAGFDAFSSLAPGSLQSGNTISISSDVLGSFFGSAVFHGRSENVTGFSHPVNPIEISVRAKVAVLGDFNDDNTLQTADLDLLTSAVNGSSVDTVFDVDFSGDINGDDRIFWITSLKGSLLGDADLNGTVEFLDFLALVDGFEQTGLGWAGGDFDGNGATQFLDFLALADNFGKSANESVASVPEPNLTLPLWLSMIAVLLIRRRSG